MNAKKVREVLTIYKEKIDEIDIFPLSFFPQDEDIPIKERFSSHYGERNREFP